MTEPSPLVARTSPSVMTAEHTLNAPERMLSLTAGTLLIANGLRRGGFKGWLQVFIGVGAAWRGYSGECLLKKAPPPSLPKQTLGPEQPGNSTRVFSHTLHIGKPRAEVFAFCRESKNVGNLIPWVDSIKEVAEHAYRWTAFGKLTRPLHWTLVEEREEENRLLHWATRFHGPRQHEIHLRFTDSSSGGTQVEVAIFSQTAPETFVTALSAFSDKALLNVLLSVKQHLEAGTALSRSIRPL
ncbi:MAG: hypothetical protein JWP80_121 [Pseudomonas sp.]|nr:hypothetical protein [Pseudomonas sp.]